MQDSPSLLEARSLYLDLLKRSLLNLIYPEADASLSMGLTVPEFIKKKAAEWMGREISEPVQRADREEGKDWPRVAHTMIGMKRLTNLQTCVEQVIQRGVPGDLIETGVWRGGACIFMRGILKAYGVTDRRVWVADSFAGLPRPRHEVDRRDPAGNLFRFKELAVSLEQVQANFERYGLLDNQVQFLKGWFSQTLPHAPFDRLAIARLDGDLYESTQDALTALYPKLSVGGYIIIDDFSLEPCRKAVEDYRQAHQIREPIVPVDWTGVYWQRER